MSTMLLFKCIWSLILHHAATADDYTVAATHKSLVVALGCFWCAEEAFEHYAPGVVEAVSGYSGGTSSNPTYHNHAGHMEVVLVEYDPTKTSYEVLLNYAWRNMDPFDGAGQFCDKGSSYHPAIFYDGEEERLVAERVLGEILEANPSWSADQIEVSLQERSTFWKAEEYHQNYYIENPGNYAYYKERCGRTDRLIQVWGEEVYHCYHDLDASCFPTVANSSGVEVDSEVNVKGIPESKAGLLPPFAVAILACVGVAAPLCMCCYLYLCWQKRKARKAIASTDNEAFVACTIDDTAVGLDDAEIGGETLNQTL